MFCILLKYILEIRLENFSFVTGVPILFSFDLYSPPPYIKLLEFRLNTSHPSNHFHSLRFSALSQLVSSLKGLKGASWRSPIIIVTRACIIKRSVPPWLTQQRSRLGGAFFASIVLHFSSEVLVLFIRFEAKARLILPLLRYCCLCQILNMPPKFLFVPKILPAHLILLSPRYLHATP